jgi:hypothetical protein
MVTLYSKHTKALTSENLWQETESITRYSQDPIHPERLEVTYVTRQKQRDDSHIEFQYDDIAIDQSEARGDEEEGALGHYLSHPPSHTSSSRPSSALSRPLSASASLDPARSRMRRPGTPQSAGRDGDGFFNRFGAEIGMGATVRRQKGGERGGALSEHDGLLPRYKDPPSERMAWGGGGMPAGGDGRTGARGRPSTAPSHEGGHHRQKWEHRQEILKTPLESDYT